MSLSNPPGVKPEGKFQTLGREDAHFVITIKQESGGRDPNTNPYAIADGWITLGEGSRLVVPLSLCVFRLLP